MKPSRRDFLKWTSALVVGSAFHGLGKAQSGTIKIGFVSPRTGPLAAFAQPDDFTLEQVRKATGGKVRGGGRTYNPITWKSYTRIPSPTPTAPPR